jgi:hypothetical protein
LIRRLYLYRPITEDDARAAGAWAEKLGDNGLTISYRPSTVPMRILMFDAVNEKGNKRREKVRLLPHPEESVADALRDAMASGDVVFNVYTGREDDRSASRSNTDAVFTVAFPEGEALAYFARVQGGIAPGIAASCYWRSVCLTQFSGNYREVYESIRSLFFKRRPQNIRDHEERVMCFAMDRLDELPVGRDLVPAARSLRSEELGLSLGR